MLLCSASSPFLFSFLIHSLDNPVRWCSFAFICIRKTPKSSSQPKLIPEHRTDYRTSDQLAGCLISISDSISQNLAPGPPRPVAGLPAAFAPASVASPSSRSCGPEAWEQHCAALRPCFQSVRELDRLCWESIPISSAGEGSLSHRLTLLHLFFHVFHTKKEST